jgi:uncharacterized membrane protein
MPRARLTVWRFPEPGTAGDAVAALEDLDRRGLLDVHDAATVSWAAGDPKPTVHQSTTTAASGALGGAFWGMLFGLIFFVPLLGAAVGAAAGALAGSLADVGIDDNFINQVRDRVTPGTSAMFLLSTDAVVEEVREALTGQRPFDLIFTHLSAEQEAALRKVFAGA